jgi:hypothetical protein
MSVLKDFQTRQGPGYITKPAGTTMQTANGTLTAANVIAMGTTPITLVPACPTGYFIMVERICLRVVTTATVFNIGGIVHFYYHGQTTEIMSATIAAATINATAGTTSWILLGVATAAGTVPTPAVGIDITNATSAATVGTGHVDYVIFYRVLPLG